MTEQNRIVGRDAGRDVDADRPRDRDVAVDPDRLWASLEEVSRIGATEAGGLHRLAGSAEDGRARDLVVAAAREVGASVRVDAVGNVFCTLAPAASRGEGAEPGVLVGSHLDSQPTAGRYDGTYGVMAGLEVLRALAPVRDRLTRPVTLAVWTDEEGARFAPSMLGSSVFAGRLSSEAALSSGDGETTLGEALRDIRYAGTDDVRPEEFCAYLEAHIEQGPMLEDEGVDIGVVEVVQAQFWTRVLLTGAQAHAGTFPLEQRRDALLVASELVVAVREIGLLRPGVGRATVGRLVVRPNSPNVVPGEVELVVELRHPDAGEVSAMWSEVEARLAEIAGRHGVRVETERLLDSQPVRFDEGVVGQVELSARRLGLSWRRMISGAGHDAVPVSDHVPTGMIFVPCHGGVSHAESESMTREWAADGAAVLLETVVALAE